MKFIRIPFAALLLCRLITFAIHPNPAMSDDLLVIDDASVFPFEDLYTDELFAYQPFPIDSISAQILTGSETTLNPDLLLQAASSVEQVTNYLEKSGVTVDSATPAQILHAFSVEPKEPNITNVMNVYPDVKDLFIPDQGMLLKPTKYDPYFVARAFDSELVDQKFKDSYCDRVPASELEQGIKVNREFAIDLLQSYEIIGNLNGLKPQLVSETFAYADSNMSRWLRFSEMAKYALIKDNGWKTYCFNRK